MNLREKILIPKMYYKSQSRVDKPNREASILMKSKLLSQNLIVYVAFLLVFAFFSILLGDTFLSVPNILNITRQTAMISVMAIAMTLVISSGMIDLSIGSITALSGLVAALILRETNIIFLGLSGGLVIGALIGFVNGILITKARIPAFLATLGTMGMVRGFAMWITDRSVVPIHNRTFNTIFGIGNIGVIPVLFFWTIFFVIVGYFLLNRLSFGRYVLATGGNQLTAQFSGINTDRIKIKVMVLSGLFAGFAGIMYASRMQAARHTIGEGDELSVIAAVILGGTSMAGGQGSIVGALVGSLLVGMINNGLILAGLDVSQQMVIRGAIIILATAISNRSALGFSSRAKV